MKAYQKSYVQVELICTNNGVLKPTAIYWNDGRRFPIDKTTRVSKDPPNSRIVYDVLINGQERKLYEELQYNFGMFRSKTWEQIMWYVEV